MERKAGIFRTKFSLESVIDLRESLRSLGSGLLVSMEKPEDFIPQLIQPETETTVIYALETCTEEKAVEKNLK